MINRLVVVLVVMMMVVVMIVVVVVVVMIEVLEEIHMDVVMMVLHNDLSLNNRKAANKPPLEIKWPKPCIGICQWKLMQVHCKLVHCCTPSLC